MHRCVRYPDQSQSKIQSSFNKAVVFWGTLGSGPIIWRIMNPGWPQIRFSNVPRNTKLGATKAPFQVPQAPPRSHLCPGNGEKELCARIFPQLKEKIYEMEMKFQPKGRNGLGPAFTPPTKGKGPERQGVLTGNCAATKRINKPDWDSFYNKEFGDLLDHFLLFASVVRKLVSAFY